MKEVRPPIDWRRVRERLERAARSFAQHQTLPPDRSRALLEKRARLLAQPPPPPVGERRELLEFNLGTERFALEPSLILEVLRLPVVTSVPGAPSFLRGIVNLRGEVLPLLEPRGLLGLPAGPAPDARTRMLVLGEDRPELGLIADEVLGVNLVPVASLHDPVSLPQEKREYVHAVSSDGLVWLSGRHLLGDPHLIVDDSRPRPAREDTR